jgi:hypothetical protein
MKHTDLYYEYNKTKHSSIPERMTNRYVFKERMKDLLTSRMKEEAK